MRHFEIVRKMSQFSFIVVQNLESASGRIGILESNESSMKTPGYFIHTLSGSVPHLTKEVWNMAFPSSTPFLQISIDSTYTFHENVKPSGKGISEFVGHAKSPSLLTVHNPLRDLLPGFNDKLGISIWTRKGRQSVTSTKFLEIINNYQPTFFQIISDYDVTALSSAKRIKKSIERNIESVNEVFQKTNGGGFATIEAAWFHVSPKEAETTLRKILEKQDAMQGFVINGIVSKCDNTVKLDKEILPVILSLLPPNKPRFIQGNLKFIEILDLVKSGIDLFDSSAVTQAVENGQAFHLVLDSFLPNSIPSIAKVDESLPLHSNSPPSSSNGVNAASTSEPTTLLLDLKDKRYFDDFSPLASGCACYSCRKFTRAYIHHLLATSELLGPILLMMHNLNQFDLLFQAIRHALTDDKIFNRLYNYLK